MTDQEVWEVFAKVQISLWVRRISILNSGSHCQIEQPLVLSNFIIHMCVHVCVCIFGLPLTFGSSQARDQTHSIAAI